MSLEEELGSRLREVIRAEQRAFPEPVDLEGRLIRAVGRARPGPRRPGIARELTLAAALLLFVAVVGGGVTAIHWLSQARGTATTKTPAPTASPSTGGGASLISAVTFVSSERGWVVVASPADSGARQLLTTVDRGRHWSSQLTWTGNSSMSRNGEVPAVLMTFVDAAHGFVLDPNASAGRAVLFRTADGGSTWQRLALPGALAPGSPLAFVDPENGWLLADVNAAMGQSAATIYRTRDGGDHWTAIAHVDYGATAANGLSSAGDKDSLVFASTSTGWLTAFTITGAPLVWSTNDGGVSWTQRPLPAPAGVYVGGNESPLAPVPVPGGGVLLPVQINLVPAPNGQPQTVPSGGYPSALYLYSSAGAGQAWSPPLRLPASGSDAGPLVLKVLDRRHWWVGSGTQLWSTADGGATWSTSTLPGVLASIDFTTASTGLAVTVVPSAPGTFARQTTLLTSSDGGAHWQAVSLPSAA